MCGVAAIPWLLGGALLGGAATSIGKTPNISMPEINSYTPQSVGESAQSVEAPTQSPVMTTQGQEQAEDEQKATEQRIRKNRQGRNALRIDRTVPNNSGLAGGSGVNVPER